MFDCDGTLWSSDAGAHFMEWSLENGLVAPERADWLRNRYAAYHAGAVDELTICGEMVQVYAGLREDEVRAAAARFVEEHTLPGIFPALEELVRRLRRAGVELWAVSSTCNWVIEAAVVERFGIPKDRVLAARVAVHAGIVTNRLLAVPTDEGKAAALRAAGVARPDAAFGNSVHDLQMLEMARDPYAVNPSTALEAEAEARGWPVFWPESRKLADKADLAREAAPEGAL